MYLKLSKSVSDKLTTTYSFTLTETTKLYSQLYANGVGTIFDNVIMNFQIEKGTEATSYEPYQEQSTLIDMNKPNLCNITNWQGHQYSNGLPGSVNSQTVERENDTQLQEAIKLFLDKTKWS